MNKLQPVSPADSDSPRKAPGIADTSGQDIKLAPPSRRRRFLIAEAIVVLVVVALATVTPLVNNWLQAEVSVPRERLRLATVRHGDLIRDVSVEGRSSPP